MKRIRSLTFWSGLLVLLVFAAAAVLSYEHQRLLAQRNLISHPWLFPIVVDMAMAAVSFLAVERAVNGRSFGWERLAIGFFVLTSIALNVAYAWPALLPSVMAAIPAVTLVVTWELLMRNLRDVAMGQRVDVAKVRAGLAQARQEKQDALERVEFFRDQLASTTAERDGLRRSLDKLQPEVDRLRRSLDKLQALPAGFQELTAVLARWQNGDGSIENHLDAALAEAAEATGVSASSLARLKPLLRE